MGVRISLSFKACTSSTLLSILVWSFPLISPRFAPKSFPSINREIFISPILTGLRVNCRRKESKICERWTGKYTIMILCSIRSPVNSVPLFPADAYILWYTFGSDHPLRIELLPNLIVVSSPKYPPALWRHAAYTLIERQSWTLD